MNLDRKILRDWRDKKESLLAVKNKNNKYRCNRKNGEKKNFSDQQEDEIKNWIIENRTKHIPVSTKNLISFAGSLNEKFKNKQNKTKLKWAYRFLKHYDFSIRRVSHLGQSLPRDNNVVKSKFISDIIKARKDLNIPYNEDCLIINMD